MFGCKIANKPKQFVYVDVDINEFAIIPFLLLSGIGYEANSPVVHPTRYTWDPSATKMHIPVLSSDSNDSPWMRCVFTLIYVRVSGSRL
jgi:hypothetical protein